MKDDQPAKEGKPAAKGESKTQWRKKPASALARIHSEQRQVPPVVQWPAPSAAWSPARLAASSVQWAGLHSAAGQQL